MRLIFWLPISALLVGCSATSPFFKAVEDIGTDNAIKIEIQKEALERDTDIQILLDIGNSGLFV